MTEIIEPRYFVEAVAKAMDVMESFSSPDEELSIAEIVRRAGMTYCSTFRLLYTLEKRGYVMRVEGSKRYRLVQARKRFRIGYAALDYGCPYSAEISRGMTRAARKHEVGLITSDNERSPAKVLANTDALLEERVHLVVMHQPYQDVSARVAARCREARVPLLAIDFAHSGAYYFGADHFRAGRLAGQYLRANAQGRSRVLILSPVPMNDAHAAYTRGVVEGLRPGLAWDPRIDALAIGGASADRCRSLRNLLKDSSTGADGLLVAVASDGLAAAADRALGAMGASATTVAGLGGSSERVARLRRGSPPWAVTISCFPETYGDRIVRVAIRILEGEQTGPAFHTEHVLLTPENLAQYYPAARSCGPVEIPIRRLQRVSAAV